MPTHIAHIPDTALTTTPVPVSTPSPARREFVIDNDTRHVAPLIAQLCDEVMSVGVCDQGGSVRVSVALEEALLNAIYHGNLEISSELKECGDEPFYALARERRETRPYCSRRVRVVLNVTPARATFEITDEGPGFDASKLPDPTDPENLERPCGRGLLLMRAFMDDVRYSPAGNRVTLVLTRKTE